MLTRRQFFASAASLAAVSALPRRSWAVFLEQAPGFPLHETPGGGLVFQGEGGSVLVLPSTSGPLMVDAKFVHTAEDLSKQVAGKTGAMPTLLINTHHHPDHSGGIWIFSPTAEIVAHKNFKARVSAMVPGYREQARNRVSELRAKGASGSAIEAAAASADKIVRLTIDHFAPKRGVDKDLTLKHGEVEVQLHHDGSGHTDNDLVVFFPALNILHMGDLVFNRCHPFIDRPAGATTVGWQNSARQALKLCDDKTVVIPGHGPVDTKGAITRQIEYFDVVRAAVQKEIKAGKSRNDIGTLQLDAFRDYEFQQFRPRAFQAMYDELTSAAP